MLNRLYSFDHLIHLLLFFHTISLFLHIRLLLLFLLHFILLSLDLLTICRLLCSRCSSSFQRQIMRSRLPPPFLRCRLLLSSNCYLNLRCCIIASFDRRISLCSNRLITTACLLLKLWKILHLHVMLGAYHVLLRKSDRIRIALGHALDVISRGARHALHDEDGVARGLADLAVVEGAAETLDFH